MGLRGSLYTSRYPQASALARFLWDFVISGLPSLCGFAEGSGP